MISQEPLVAAIKIYREVYPELGLFEAKNAVQAIKAGKLEFQSKKKVCPNCNGTGVVDV